MILAMFAILWHKIMGNNSKVSKVYNKSENSFTLSYCIYNDVTASI